VLIDKSEVNGNFEFTTNTLDAKALAAQCKAQNIALLITESGSILPLKIKNLKPKMLYTAHFRYKIN
jgi:hypothetical protein